MQSAYSYPLTVEQLRNKQLLSLLKKQASLLFFTRSAENFRDRVTADSEYFYSYFDTYLTAFKFSLFAKTRSIKSTQYVDDFFEILQDGYAGRRILSTSNYTPPDFLEKFDELFAQKILELLNNFESLCFYSENRKDTMLIEVALNSNYTLVGVSLSRFLESLNTVLTEDLREKINQTLTDERIFTLLIFEELQRRQFFCFQLPDALGHSLNFLKNVEFIQHFLNRNLKLKEYAPLKKRKLLKNKICFQLLNSDLLPEFQEGLTKEQRLLHFKNFIREVKKILDDIFFGLREIPQKEKEKFFNDHCPPRRIVHDYLDFDIF